MIQGVQFIESFLEGQEYSIWGIDPPLMDHKMGKVDHRISLPTCDIYTGETVIEIFGNPPYNKVYLSYADPEFKTKLQQIIDQQWYPPEL